ncbi:MAG: hypothetical protein HY916_03295 [Desulfovibrio sp.]|jgi:hypothetical protein|nr:hypothetical protein [Desulfovibrio sp.]
MNRTPQNMDQNIGPRPISLPNDFGDAIGLTGTLVAEDIHFSTATGLLTVEKLYRSAEGKVAYGIIAASGDSRERRAYVLDEQGETVLADNGSYTVELPVNDMFELLAMVLQAEDARATIGEHLMVRPAVNED